MALFDILNEDFMVYEAFEPFLKKCLSKSSRELPTGSLLQIQQVVNISIPKREGEGGQQQYDGDKQILKITLTDGEATVYAVVTEPIPRLSMNTPPGTKLKLAHNVSAHGQIIMLSRHNAQIMGGDVPKLIEKWKFQKAMEFKKDWGAVGRNDGGDGPPLWKPFGQKTVPLDVSVLRKMKAMDIVNESKDKDAVAGDTQFDQQRSEAISELGEKGAKQKWQKPNKKLIDKEVQDLMDEGFSFEEASNALSRFRNQQKALRFLKASKGELPDRSGPLEERRERGRRKTSKFDDEEDDAPVPREFQRPSNSISLFGFIADTISVPQGSANQRTASPDRQQQYEYDTHPGRGGRMSGGNYRGGGGRGYQRGQRSGYDNRPDSAYNKPEESSNYNARGGGRGRGRGYRGDNDQGRRSDHQDFQSRTPRNQGYNPYQDKDSFPPPRFEGEESFPPPRYQDKESFPSPRFQQQKQYGSNDYQPRNTSRGRGENRGYTAGNNFNRDDDQPRNTFRGRGGNRGHTTGNNFDRGDYEWSPQPSDSLVFRRGGTATRGRGGRGRGGGGY